MTLAKALEPFIGRARQPGFDKARDDEPCTFFCKDVRELLAAAAAPPMIKEMPPGAMDLRPGQITYIAEAGWRPIERAPRDGTLIDLWGYDRDPDPKKGGILLPIELSLGRWTNCLWCAPLTVSRGGFISPIEKCWYQQVAEVDISPGAVTKPPKRIWPTHYMPIPAGPT